MIYSSVARLVAGCVLSTLAHGYTMNLGPAAGPYQKASVFYNSSMWSWGGSVIEAPEDPTWRYHIFAAAFINNCGLSAWEYNSEVIHGVANDPAGPFTFLDVALPVWHHNPQIVRQKDGTYTIYTIAYNTTENTANCTHSDDLASLLEGGHPAEMMSLHSSSSLYGPWDLVNLNIFSGTNPSPWVNEDGSVYVASHSRAVMVSTAADWRGPYSSPVAIAQPLEADVNWEDPFLFFDAPAGVWRLLAHSYNATNHTVQVRAQGLLWLTGMCMHYQLHSDHCIAAPRLSQVPHYSRIVHATKTSSLLQVLVGATAHSTNSSLWSEWVVQPYDQPVYTTIVPFSDGSTTQLKRRERPKVLLNATTGAPAFLYTGVCPSGSDADDCFTLGVPVLGTSDE